METNRRKEVINICLDHFIEKGLSEVSTRSLSGALKLQNAGLYYYFANKDEVVISCADEAAMRLEHTLISRAIKDLENPEKMINDLKSKAYEMAPTMKFLVAVCASKRYEKEMKPVLDRLANRYKEYTELVAKKLNCDKKEIEPYVYMTITAVSNYMIFAKDGFVAPQIELVKDAIIRLTHLSNDAG